MSRRARGPLSPTIILALGLTLLLSACDSRQPDPVFVEPEAGSPRDPQYPNAKNLDGWKASEVLHWTSGGHSRSVWVIEDPNGARWLMVTAPGDGVAIQPLR